MGRRPAPHYDSAQGRWYCRWGGRFHTLGRDVRGLVRPVPPAHVIAAFARVLERGDGSGDASAPPTGRPVYVAQVVARWCAEHPGRWARDMARKLCEWQPELRLADVRPCSRDDEEPGTLGEFARWLQTAGARRVEVRPKRGPDGSIVRAPDGQAVKVRTERREPASAQTVRHAVGFALRILRWAARPSRGWLRPSQVGDRPRTPCPVPRPRDLSADTVRGLLATKLGAAEPPVRFLFATGARPGEACRLDWADVDLSRCTAALRQSKTSGRTGKSRIVFLTPEAVAVLVGLGERRTGPVFLNKTGRPYTASALGKILRRRGVTAYQGRHTFAQAVLDQYGIEDVAKLLGHSDLRMAQVYARVRDDRARSVVAGLVLPGSAPTPSGRAASGKARPRRTGPRTPRPKRDAPATGDRSGEP